MERPKDLYIEAPEAGADYAEFVERHKAALLQSAAAAIDPNTMNMDRQQALTLGGAMKACGFDRMDFAAIMAKSPQDKGIFSSERQWAKFTGRGQHGTAGEGTIFKFAQLCGWKWPAPSEYEDGAAATPQKSKQDQAPQKKPLPRLVKRCAEDFKIVCIMDGIGYGEKPAKNEVWEIRKREKVPTPDPEPMTIVDFVRAVVTGHTFSPTVYSKEDSGRRTNDGKIIYEYRPVKQQLFVVDIDNEERVKDDAGQWITRRIEHPLTVEAALDICRKHEIMPFFVYETFSSKKHRDDPEKPYKKFRLCFATDEPITVQEYGARGIREIINYFISIFGKAADGRTTDPARLIYGTDERDKVKAVRYIIDHEKLDDMVAASKGILHPEAAPEYEKEAYKATSAAGSLPDFLNGIKANANTPAISTGFKYLDGELDGGFYEGLHIIGAVSSLGKTTFTLQIADQIAAQGHDVLIISLEMAKSQLMAKSISRLTFKACLDEQAVTQTAKTSRGITDGSRYEKYSAEDKARINQAVKKYWTFADHVYIIEAESVANMSGVDQVKGCVSRHIEMTGNNPVVIVDYLQMLEPDNPRATDKQNMDAAVKGLKRISRRYKIPVIAISSFNRGNYNSSANEAAFKESGSIEYSADVLLGLQFKNVKDDNFSLTEAKKKDEREIELVILKQREGHVGGSVSYKYYPAFNYFTETGLTIPTKYNVNDLELPERPESKRVKAKERLLKAIEQVKKLNGGKNPTIEDLAVVMDVQRSTVKRHLKEYGGFTITGEDGQVVFDGNIKREEVEAVEFEGAAISTPFDDDGGESIIIGADGSGKES